MDALTFTVPPWGVVEGEAQGNDGSDFQDYERDILQGLPHQLQEGLGLLGGDEVLSECFMTILQIKWVTRKSYTHTQTQLRSIKSNCNIDKH